MRSDSTPVRPWTFFALTFILSWLIWIPLTLSHLGIGPFHIPEGTSSGVRLLGVLMPAVAALLLTARAGGRGAVRSLLGRLTIWRVGWRWWAAAVLVSPGLLVLSGLVYNWFGGQPPITLLPQTSAVALIINVIFLLIATLGEEIGWRGVALPALQQRHSALSASLILGVVWATWHLPFWLLLDTYAQYGVSYLVLNYLLVVPMTPYITWLYNNGRSSLLLPVAYHISFNVVNVALLPVTPNIGAFAVFIVTQWVVALLVVRRILPASVKAQPSTM